MNQMQHAPLLRDAEDFSLVLAALGAFTRATGRTPMLLGGWEVETDGIGPPAALARRLATLPQQPRHYTYSRDLHAAREYAAALFGRDTRLGGNVPQPEELAIVPNSSQGLYLALAALREGGVRRAVVAGPTYYSAVVACRHLGLETVFVPTADFLSGTLDLPRIVAATRGAPAVVLVTNPAYSLGMELRPAALRELCAALPADVTLLLDETRLGLDWRSDQPWYGFDFPPNAVILRSPSKIFFLNGAKTSILLARREVIAQVERIGEALLGSVAGNAEAVALAYLETWQRWHDEVAERRVGPLRRWKRNVVATLRRNRAELEAALAPVGITLAPTDSGPYALAALPAARAPTLDSLTCARDHGVLLMTSDYFYHTHPAWRGFRINLCGCPIQAREGLARLMA